jgi:type II secretory pathway component PulK
MPSDDYIEGYEKGKAVALRSEEWTNRIIALLVALTLVALAAIIAWSVHSAAQREQTLRLTCIDQGGIWSFGGCVWSESASEVAP